MNNLFRFVSRHGVVVGAAVVVLVAIVVLVVRPADPGPAAGQESASGQEAASGEPMVVVATFSLIGDWVRQVGGEHIDVRVLIPPGAEVHEWELQPRNFIDLETTELVFYNGLMLEQWMHQVDVAVAEEIPRISLAEQGGYPTRPIVSGDFSGEPDPHMWMDPRAVKRYVAVIAETLATHDPQNADAYRARAETYSKALDSLHESLSVELGALPDRSRVLITSEAAFPYFADTYDFYHDGVWGNNAEVEGSPRQIRRIMEVIEQRRPAAVFWESTISDRYVRSVARDAGIEVAGPLYVDSLGVAGSGIESYMDMMRHNARVIIEALGESQGS